MSSLNKTGTRMLKTKASDQSSSYVSFRRVNKNAQVQLSVQAEILRFADLLGFQNGLVDRFTYFELDNWICRFVCLRLKVVKTPSAVLRVNFSTSSERK